MTSQKDDVEVMSNYGQGGESKQGSVFSVRARHAWGFDSRTVGGMCIVGSSKSTLDQQASIGGAASDGRMRWIRCKANNRVRRSTMQMQM